MKNKEKYRIVITDNNPIIIEGFISLFSQHSDHQVVGVAHDSEDLRVLLSKVSIDTLFLDVNLSSTNIYQLIKDLVLIHADIKIIVFSNYTTPKLIQDVMEFGAHAYLSKKASLKEIIESIDRVHKGERFISASVYQRAIKPRPVDRPLSIELKDEFIHFSSLTEREMDIVTLLSRGYTNKEMAEKLYLSKYTIETHRKNLMKKLNLKTSAQLIYFAVQQGLV